MIIKKFLGWHEATIDEYKSCYQQYGGNFSTHPDVLSYFHNNEDCKEKFYLHESKGKINGAVCVWADKYLANDITSEKVVGDHGFPVAKDELILPITKERKIYVPFKSKIISPINKNIVNRSEIINARRTICLAKPLESFSKKTRYNRNTEVKKFTQKGGEIRDQSEFTSEEIIEIYASLFKKRRGSDVKNREKLQHFCSTFRENIFGKVLFYKKQPCAFQLITKSDSCGILSFDFINIGTDISIKDFSLGTIIMWLNLNEATSISKTQNKKIRFSYGRPTFSYKNMWCFQEKLGRLL